MLAERTPAAWVWRSTHLLTASGGRNPREISRLRRVNGDQERTLVHGFAMPSVMMPFWLYTDNPLTPEVYAQTLEQRFGDDASTVRAQYTVEAYGSATYAYSAVDTDLQNACYTRTINRLAAAYTRVYAYEFDDANAPYSFWELVFNGPLPYAPDLAKLV